MLGRACKVNMKTKIQLCFMSDLVICNDLANILRQTFAHFFCAYFFQVSARQSRAFKKFVLHISIEQSLCYTKKRIIQHCMRASTHDQDKTDINKFLTYEPRLLKGKIPKLFENLCTAGCSQWPVHCKQITRLVDFFCPNLPGTGIG